MSSDNNLIHSDVSLKDMTTLGVGGKAAHMCWVSDTSQLPRLRNFSKKNDLEIFVVGEGSNLVVSDKGFGGLIIKFKCDNIRVTCESTDFVRIEVDAGRNWDSLVEYSVNRGWWGLENLSLIPGTVGACPVQNVGAYGQECKNLIVSVKVFDLQDGIFRSLSNEECKFSFRESIFNTSAKGRFIITSVEFQLSKLVEPIVTRGEIRNSISLQMDSSQLQLAIRKRVIELRTSGKALPVDPCEGSAGTFYRTTVVSLPKLMLTFCKSFIKLSPKIAAIIVVFGWKYRNNRGFRIPSRMIIDACGLAGSSVGDVSLYNSNSAVLITDKTGKPSTSDIIALTKKIRKVVYKNTGFKVPIEPTLVGFSSEEIDEIFKV